MSLEVLSLFSTARQTFLGYRIQQTWSALLMLEQVLADNADITRVLELGTGFGGLTLFFGLHMQERSGKVLSFDIVKKFKPEWTKWTVSLPIVFEERNAFMQDTVAHARDFIQEGRALVFCDDGDKKREFPLYAGILKTDDLIMAHDWGINLEMRMEHLNGRTLSILEFYRQREFNKLQTRILSMKRK